MDKHITEQPIRDIMTSSPVSVRPETTIAELKALFERYDFNAFPVVDEQGILRGLVSKLDLLRAFRPDKRRGMAGLLPLWAERVEEVMSRGILAVEPHEQTTSEHYLPLWGMKPTVLGQCNLLDLHTGTLTH